MGFLSFLKGMKIEDNCPVDVTFRTSRTCGAFGVLLISSGLGMLWQVYTQNPLFCCFSLVAVGSCLAAGILTFLGLLILTYRKCVIISKVHSRIDYLESSLFCRRRATYHFADLLHIEVSPIAQCFLSNRTCMWTVKAYFRRDLHWAPGIRLFESLSSDEAKEAGLVLSQILNRPIVPQESMAMTPSFTSQAGI